MTAMQRLFPGRWTLIAGLMVMLISGCARQRSAEPSTPFVVAERNASTPTTAIDPNTGSVHWAWFGHDGEGRSAIYSAVLSRSDASPSEPIQVNPPGVSVNAHPQAPPQIAVSPDGTVYVAWSTRQEIEGRRFPASNLLLARSVDGGRSFEEPIYVNDDHDGPPAGHTFHNLAVGPDGSVFVSWLDSRPDDVVAHAVPVPSGFTYDHPRGPSAPFFDDAYRNQAPHNEMDTLEENENHGRHSASSTSVRVARSSDGTQFEPSVVVVRGTCQCCRTGLHIDQNGALYIAWRHIFGENTRDIAVARSYDGGRTFSLPTRVHEDGWDIDGCPHAGPSIATDAHDAVHVGWYTAAPGRIGVYYAVSETGGTSFGEPQSLASGVPISRVDVEPTSSATWLVWEEQREIRLRRSSDPESAVRTLHGSAPTLAHAAGRTAIAWEQDGRILAAFLE